MHALLGALGAALAAAAPSAGAQSAGTPSAGARSVVLSGSLGARKALLLIDGQPHTLAVGASARGVTLHALRGDSAEVEVAGQRLLLRIGATPVQVGAAPGPAASGREILLAAGPGGHFVTEGQINGRRVRFLVDTGATSVAMGQAEATRLGLPWRTGQRGIGSTANGNVPIYRVVLDTVRVGEVQVSQVDAVVLPGEMPHILLGNSFLSRFSMQRDADVLKLVKR